MNINSIYGFNPNGMNINSWQARNVASETIEEKNLDVNKAASETTEEEYAVLQKRGDLSPEEAFGSFNLKRNREFELIGANSTEEDLDVDKAMSDIKKDSILDQYRFFVNANNKDDEDGSVRRVIRKN